MPNRAGNAQLPEIKLLDLRGKKLQSGICQELLNVIKKHVDQGGQVLLFLNRRGFAPILMCHQCGWVISCKYCDTRLTLHHKPARLLCHHCGFSQTPPKYCENCQQSELISLGNGTERIEQELKKQFPQFPILRIDKDTVRGNIFTIYSNKCTMKKIRFLLEHKCLPKVIICVI